MYNAYVSLHTLHNICSNLFSTINVCWLRSLCHAGAAVDLQRLSSELAGGDESGAEENGFSSFNGSGDSIRQLEPSLDSSSASALTGAPPTRAHLPQAHEPPLAPPLSFSFSPRQSHPHSHSSRLSPPTPARPHLQQLHQQQHHQQQQHQQHQLSVRVRDEGSVRSSGPATSLTGWSNLNAALEGRFARQQREGNLSQEFTARVLTDIAFVASLISSILYIYLQNSLQTKFMNLYYLLQKYSYCTSILHKTH